MCACICKDRYAAVFYQGPQLLLLFPLSLTLRALGNDVAFQGRMLVLIECEECLISLGQRIRKIPPMPDALTQTDTFEIEIFPH